jgi:3',5'-nucleoside bisphosphate phosphatase
VHDVQVLTAMPWFDGHLHSTASDGQLPPEALVDEVARRGGRAFALTDHDTFAGHARAAARARERGVELVPGVEMSVEYRGREIHLLAWFVGAEARELAEALDAAARARRAHLAAMLARLGELGYPLSEAEVLAEVGAPPGEEPASIGRPHVARALVKRGHFRSVVAVFDKLLGEGKPGRVRRKLPPAEAMIAAARRGGGVCAVAHPGVNDVKPPELAGLRDAGLAALEVYHPNHGSDDVVHYLRQCRRLSLVPTGGSDFHGGAGSYPADGPGLDQAGFERLRAAAGAAS